MKVSYEVPINRFGAFQSQQSLCLSRADASRIRSGRLETMSLSPQQLQESWTKLRPLLTIRNEREYDRVVKRLDLLLDEIGTEERHPLYEIGRAHV